LFDENELLNPDDIISGIEPLAVDGAVGEVAQTDAFVNELSDFADTLESINVSESPETLETHVEDEKLLDMNFNLEDIETKDLVSDVEEPPLDEVEKLSLDDVNLYDETNLKNDIPEELSNVVSMDDITPINENEIEPLDEEFDFSENLSLDNIDGLENFDADVEENEESGLEEKFSLDELENPEDSQEKEVKGFGTNLLNSLNADDPDILINEEPSSEKLDENINLDEIDNLLNLNSEENPEPADESSFNMDEIDSILGLNDENNSSESDDASLESVLEDLNDLTSENVEQEEEHNNEIKDSEMIEASTLDTISGADISFINESAINQFEETDTENSSFEDLTGENTNNEAEDSDNLEMLFDEDLTEEKIPEEYENIPENTPPGLSLNSNKAGNKNIIIITACVLGLVALGGIGIGLSHKTANDSVPVEESVPAPITQAGENNIPAPPQAVPDNIPDINSQMPQAPVNKSDISNAPKVVTTSKPAQNTVNNSSDAYLSVKNITWQVPDYLSYSDAMKAYLKTAGKSIKLSLSSDLLLATEYAYSNQVKINMKISNSGNVQQATIVSSSGSTEIDKIVLQSVKSTLNVVKPPVSVIKTPEFSLTITINL